MQLVIEVARSKQQLEQIRRLETCVFERREGDPPPAASGRRSQWYLPPSGMRPVERGACSHGFGSCQGKCTGNCCVTGAE